MAEPIRVLLLENVHQKAVESLRNQGFEVVHHVTSLEGKDLYDAARNAHIVGIRSKTTLSAEFFAEAKQLWAVGAFCIGTNQVDLAAAAGAGVPVFNAPFSNTRSVAELTIAEIIALHRQLGDRSAEVHRGVWKKTAEGCHEVRTRTVGIVGYGHIGSQVSVLAEAMGMKVIYFDIVDVLPHGNAIRMPSFDALLEQADIVTLHVPETPETMGMVSASALAKMRKGAVLINNARGTVVDVDALAESLRSGHLSGAAIDVFPSEPAGASTAFQSPLQGIPTVILTPHVGGSTLEAQIDIAESVSSRLARFVSLGSTATAVNVPEVALPRLHRAHHRVLHFHRNVPGVLSHLNAAIAELGINIAAQFLQSDQQHSFAILDVNGGDSTLLRDRLAAIPETISVRVIW